MQSKLPIGYYLKKTDNLLTEGINQVHKALGITRTDWQILNSINENVQLDRRELGNLISEFASEGAINEAISVLIDRHLIQDSGYFSLTDKGRDLYQTCLQKQKEFRQKAMKDISEQEYFQTIATLEKIIHNLS